MPAFTASPISHPRGGQIGKFKDHWELYRSRRSLFLVQVTVNARIIEWTHNFDKLLYVQTSSYTGTLGTWRKSPGTIPRDRIQGWKLFGYLFLWTIIVLKDQSLRRSIFHTTYRELLCFNKWLIKSLAEVRTLPLWRHYWLSSPGTTPFLKWASKTFPLALFLSHVMLRSGPRMCKSEIQAQGRRTQASERTLNQAGPHQLSPAFTMSPVSALFALISSIPISPYISIVCSHGHPIFPSAPTAKLCSQNIICSEMNLSSIFNIQNALHFP